MRRFICAAMPLLMCALFSGCGGSGNSAVNPDVSQDQGVTIVLKDGGYVPSGAAGVFFPPQDIDGSISVKVSGTGSSASDQLTVEVGPVGDQSSVSKEEPPNFGTQSYVYYTYMPGSGAIEPGKYVTVKVTKTNGDVYSCASYEPNPGVIIYGNYQGYTLGPDGKYYVSCVKAKDYFNVSFYIDENSEAEAQNDLTSNIESLAGICPDKDCGDIAEPKDMERLYSAYILQPPVPSAIDPMKIVNGYEDMAGLAMNDGWRQGAYEEMLTELFTQLYLWEEYKSYMEEATGKDVGLIGVVRDITKEVVQDYGYANDGKSFIKVPKDVAAKFRELMKLSKYATYKNTLAKMDKYIDCLSVLGSDVLAVEDVIFEMDLYQLLGAAIAEQYIDAFELYVLPSVKDPVFAAAFSNVKKKLLGSNPDDRSDGLLYNNVKQFNEAIFKADVELTIDTLKFIAGNELNKILTSGIGRGAAAAKGLASIGPQIVGMVLLSGIEDRVRFFGFEHEVMLAFATFLQNNYDDFGDFDGTCPISDADAENLLLAENMFYSAGAFFSLIHDSYERWLITADLAEQDIFIWLWEALGFQDDGHLWALPRSDELGRLKTKYAAKTIKAVEMIMTCGGPISDGSGTPQCNNQCNVNQTKCAAGIMYACTTDSNGCRVWDQGASCINLQCDANFLTCKQCIPAHHVGCYDNDVYSYDSCNVRHEKLFECGVDSWDGPVGCSGDIDGDVVQQYTTRICNANACSENGVLTVKQDCGLSGPASANYCTAGDVYQDYTTRRCTSGLCMTPTTAPKKVQSCGSCGCTNGVCNQCAACGDGVKNGVEQCDKTDLGGKTCITQGFASGTLSCNSNCTFNTSACCMNNDHKQCYSGNLYWYDSCGNKGTVAQSCSCGCSGSSCTQCATCGNKIIEGTEQCDLTNLNGKSCTTQGFDSGTLGCNSNCTFNTSSCCKNNDHKQCYSGNLYWFDSCGHQGAQAEACSCGCDVNACKTCGCSSVVLNNPLNASDIGFAISLSWTANSNANGYLITRGYGGSCPPPANQIGNSFGQAIYADTSAASGQCYAYGVYAINSCGDPGNCIFKANVCKN